MRLTCPSCRSVLEVPDGTAAHVRCPTCRAVFDSRDASAPPAPRPPSAPRREAPPQRRPEQARPARKDTDDRAVEPIPAPKSTLIRDQEVRLERERAKTKELKRQLRTAAVGCKMLWAAYILYCLSLLLTMAFAIVIVVFKVAIPGLVLFSGGMGIINFVLGTAALGIIISGPNRATLRVYAVIGLVISLCHLFMLFGVVVQSAKIREAVLGPSARVNALVEATTQLPTLSNYLAFIIYPNLTTNPTPGVSIPVGLMVATGLAELTQIMFAMFALMSLSRIAGDEDLGYRCLRAGAIPFFVFNLMFFGMLGFTSLMVESGAYLDKWGLVFIVVVTNGANGIYALMMLLPMRRAADVADLCNAPMLVDEKYR